MANAKAVFGLHFGGRVHRASRSSFDRIVRTVLFATLVVVALATFAIATGLLDASSFGLAAVDDWIAGDRWLRAGALAGSAFVFGVVALSLGVRGRGGTRNRRHVVATSERGIVVVDSRSVATIAAAAARSCDGIIGLDVGVRGAGGEPVRITIYVSVIPGTDLGTTGRQIQDSAKRAVERLAGLSVQDVHVAVEVTANDDLDRLLE